MEVYGLVGKSGTGKSYQALGVCRDRGIPCLIDDGLFIGQNQIYAGQSAKRADTKMGAVKTAIFTEEEHRASVMEAIRKTVSSSTGAFASMSRRPLQLLYITFPFRRTIRPQPGILPCMSSVSRY